MSVGPDGKRPGREARIEVPDRKPQSPAERFISNRSRPIWTKQFKTVHEAERRESTSFSAFQARVALSISRSGSIRSRTLRERPRRQ
jgi:predicted metal-dependent hydrolase